MVQVQARIPPEVLDRIFMQFERDSDPFPAWDPNPGDPMVNYTPQSLFHPLLLVCKAWCGVAQRRLYRSAGIGGGPLARRKDICRWQAFYRTMSENPYLARLVRKLYLIMPSGSHPMAIAGREPREAATQQVQLFRLCQNVESVSIWGADQPFTVLLKVVLPQLDLVQLTISFGLDPLFCTRSELIVLLLNWPRLQKLSTIGAVFLKVDDDTILPDPLTSKGRCPELREISIENADLCANHLLALSIIAPNVVNANIGVHYNAEEALEPVLRNWASTLIHFCFETLDLRPISATYPSLREVHYLKVSSSSVPPGALVEHFPRLETLMYMLEFEDLDTLADVMQEESTLPSLSTLELISYSTFWVHRTDADQSTAFSSLKSACRRRGIKLEDILPCWDPE